MCERSQLKRKRSGVCLVDGQGTHWRFDCFEDRVLWRFFNVVCCVAARCGGIENGEGKRSGCVYFGVVMRMYECAKYALLDGVVSPFLIWRAA